MEECHQYIIRRMKEDSDLQKFGLTLEEKNKLRIEDFDFCHIMKRNKPYIRLCNKFIEEYEYLGKIAQRNTHYFATLYKGKIVGVQILSTPNAFSNLLGPETRNLEKLLSRGACASFTPKNLASWQIMKSTDWMVRNTEFRIFTGYSDLEAGERGKIYQACNFIYLGEKFGGSIQLFDPERPEKGWFSDREARKLSAYKRFARELGIEWKRDWNIKCKVLWENIPGLTENVLRFASREYVTSCKSRKLPPKRKYCLIKGRTKAETKRLLKRFIELNPEYESKGPNLRRGLSYPLDNRSDL